MTKYTWLLFDADDTLFDFPKAQASALQITLEQCGLPFRAEFLDLFVEANNHVWREFERGEITHFDLRTKRFRLFFDENSLKRRPTNDQPILFAQSLSG